jgi:hypothetical protein
MLLIGGLRTHTSIHKISESRRRSILPIDSEEIDIEERPTSHERKQLLSLAAKNIWPSTDIDDQGREGISRVVRYDVIELRQENKGKMRRIKLLETKLQYFLT